MKRETENSNSALNVIENFEDQEYFCNLYIGSLPIELMNDFISPSLIGALKVHFANKNAIWETDEFEVLRIMRAEMIFGCFIFLHIIASRQNLLFIERSIKIVGTSTTFLF